jgi:hypothetical protein
MRIQPIEFQQLTRPRTRIILFLIQGNKTIHITKTENKNTQLKIYSNK